MQKTSSVADRILKALQIHRSLNRTNIRELLGRGIPGARIDRALSILTEAGAITVVRIKPPRKGRPQTIICLAEEHTQGESEQRG